jgi:hypothetical protein
MPFASIRPFFHGVLLRASSSRTWSRGTAIALLTPTKPNFVWRNRHAFAAVKIKCRHHAAIVLFGGVVLKLFRLWQWQAFIETFDANFH